MGNFLEKSNNYIVAIKSEAEKEMKEMVLIANSSICFAVNYLLKNKHKWDINLSDSIISLMIDFHGKPDGGFISSEASVKLLGTDVGRYMQYPFFNFNLMYKVGVGLIIEFNEGGYGDDCELIVIYEKSNPKSFTVTSHYFFSSDPPDPKHQVKYPENIVKILQLVLE